MKSLRARNPLLFDAVVLAAFTVIALAAYLLTESANTTGALIAISALAITCAILIVSR